MMNYPQVTGDTVAVEQVNRRSTELSTEVYPRWPTSTPGPLRVLPPAHERPINRCRSEQMVEIDYNQETGEPLSAR